MGKRIFSFVSVFLLLACLTLPVCAYDDFAYPIDVLGFGFTVDNGINIVCKNGVVTGSDFQGVASDLNSDFSPTYFDCYIAYPVHYNVVSCTITARAFNSTNTCSVGTLSYNNGYVPVADCAVSATLRGTPMVDGVKYRSWTFKISVPDTGDATVNFIRLRLSVPTDGFKLTKTLSGANITGTLSAQSYWNTLSTDLSGLRQYNLADLGTSISLSGTSKCSANGASFSGTVPAVYVSGRLRSYYGSGTNDYKNYTLTTSAPSSSQNYLQIPSHAITLTNSSQITSNVSLSGSATGSDSWEGRYLTDTDAHHIANTQGYITTGDQQFTGTVGDSTMYRTVITVQASGVTDDAELVDAVESFSDRNHDDLTGIASQLQDIVDHQDDIVGTGEDIGTSTSTQTITDTSGDLGDGFGALGDTISVVSDVQTVSAPASSYISFVSATFPVLLNFGNGVLLWAVLAIIVCSVLIFVLRRIAE